MSSLINDLLAYSRVSTHATPFRRVDLNETLRDVLTDLDYALDEAGAHVDAGPLPTVTAEPMQMRQLLHNLVANSVKFRREDVPLRIAVRGRTAGGHATFEVEDNGIGLDEKYADRIFTPFQRLHSRTAYPGTGMGLAICRRIAQRHSGDIAVTGKPGEGTTFRVTLSLSPSATPESVP
jgi:light-regulated signal transduction histidine kinase (bacteriophytochrome)